MTDPRKAKSLGEAALNPDGTYNGIRALSWLSAALYPGAGLSEDEVRQIAEEVQTNHRTKERSAIADPIRSRTPKRDSSDGIFALHG